MNKSIKATLWTVAIVAVIVTLGVLIFHFTEVMNIILGTFSGIVVIWVIVYDTLDES